MAQEQTFSLSTTVTSGSTASTSGDGRHGASGGGGSTEAQQLLDQFWPKVIKDIQNLTPQHFKSQELPLARIKKIMKLDDDVKAMMISAEAPILFAKAAEIFITELSLRAWIIGEDNKRRTLQRNDIAMAISKYDQFDFLIDIVPREEVGAKPATKKSSQPGASQGVLANMGSAPIALNTIPGAISLDGGTTTLAVSPDQVQYLLQAIPQPPTQATPSIPAVAPQATQPLQIIQTPQGQHFAVINGQLVPIQAPGSQPSAMNTTAPNQQQSSNASGDSSQTSASAPTEPQPQPLQLVQIQGPNGEIQQIPLSVLVQQGAIRMQIPAQPDQQTLVIQAPNATGTSQSTEQSETGGQTQYQIGGQQFIIQSQENQDNEVFSDSKMASVSALN